MILSALYAILEPLTSGTKRKASMFSVPLRSANTITRTRMQALGCDEAAQMEAHRSCVNGLLAFHRYRDGDVAPGGIVNHTFQHVTDVASR